MIKKPVCILLTLLSLLLCEAGAVDTGEKKLIMRSAKHDGFVRIVFESSDESLIKGSNVVQTQNQLRIKFPLRFNLIAHGKQVVDASAGDNTVSININTPFKAKVAQLSSPPRLFVDIFSEEMPEPKAQKTEPLKTEIPQGFRIVLDAGHGGYDSGLILLNMREKDVALSLARDLESVFIKKNRSVFLTRKSDQAVSIRDRQLFVNQKAPSLFVSLHISSEESFVIYTSALAASEIEKLTAGEYDIRYSQRHFLEKSRSLANELGGALKEEFGVEVLIRNLPLALLDSISAPAVMIEAPVSVLQDSEAQTRLSETILRGLASYAGR